LADLLRPQLGLLASRGHTGLSRPIIDTSDINPSYLERYLGFFAANLSLLVHFIIIILQVFGRGWGYIGLQASYDPGYKIPVVTEDYCWSIYRL